MDKKYQIFISSTFEDLKEEREAVMTAIMTSNNIPAGMELFSAMDEEQLEYIKRVIDDSDYYVLIIGGRYGSTDSDGISYTEREYDYAVDKGVPTLVFIYENMDKIELGKTDKDNEKKQKLDLFIHKAKKDKMVSFWNNPDELALKVNTSITQAINRYPRIGWARADKFANEELMSDFIVSNNENKELKEKLAKIEIKPEYEGIAELEELFSFKIYDKANYSYLATYSWERIFSLFATYIKNEEYEASALNNKVASDIAEHENKLTYPTTSKIKKIEYDDIINQLECYGYISVSGNNFISLTDKGRDKYNKARLIKSKLST